MSNPEEEHSYPIGRFIPAETYTPQLLERWIGSIRSVPLLFDYCIENLDEAQLNTPYRPGGWTTVQVIHHVADSHMNAYIRLKLALTENRPEIKPYDEKLWAELPDVADVPLNVSITLIHALHRRWVSVLVQMKEEDWTREYYHPAANAYVPLWQMTNNYHWHGKHHAEQILSLRKRMGW
ncbi:YfiT family bacillithiol transferase [Pedobacter hartonius]|uniref:DinB superfamily protein n=1 Tax=Pedobacter hartonius TaxID=425514 RepID=A0A1H4CZ42_9SPHI|nr:putative metal-dependent hydrolase [Pedobacter hartonius]SEA65714.1 DinB superfamily protein [Pedobacter hartonius]